MGGQLLTINGGSSSIKFALFADQTPLRRILSGSIDRIALPDSLLVTRDWPQESTDRLPIVARDHSEAVKRLADWLQERNVLPEIRGIGHRVVHGGPKYSRPQCVTDSVLAELRRLIPLDPLHLPGEIALIEAFAAVLPGRPQIVCFDTAFHHDLPESARLLPVPRSLQDAGVRRYGFHGLSFSYLISELGRIAGPTVAKGLVILAHLGNGASLAAVRDGKSIDTSMAFTPAAGLVMGTRSGDLDPGLLVYLIRTQGMTADHLDDFVNRRCGLIGISDTSSDMRDLLARASTDARAEQAVSIFCYQAKKWIGAFAAALGGLETLVFSGGIGENAPEIRRRICEGLNFLGLRLDPGQNAVHASVISSNDSRVTVRVIPTDEEVVIARHVQRLVDAAKGTNPATDS